jgi:hypothetical protein
MNRQDRRSGTMHPMFAALFIDTGDDDLLAQEQHSKRRAHAARRARSARTMKVAAARPDRPRRP